jgi:hypothetical protein
VQHVRLCSLVWRQILQRNMTFYNEGGVHSFSEIFFRMLIWIRRENYHNMRIRECALIALSLVMILLPLTVQGQVSIQQSTTTSVNGQKTSIQTENDKTVIKISQGTLTIKGDLLKYCAQACHEYVLYENGTIGEKT